MTSVDLLNVGDFDGIRNLMNNSLKAGQDKNIGMDLGKDIETRYREDDRNVMPFPWKCFNNLTQGGPGKGDLVLIFGNPGGGKSWEIVAHGAFLAELGYNVLHYTLELTEGYVGLRYDARLTGIAVDKLKNNREKVNKAWEKLKGRIIVKGYAPKRASFETLRSHIQQLNIQEDFVPDIIFIDYLDYVKTKARIDRKTEIDDVYVEAKSLAAEMNCPVISPSQANRTGAKSDIIEGDNAAGSYDKIMIADIIISLARSRKDKINNTGKWHIMKNRYGTDGLTFGSKIDLSCGKIEIFDTPLDDTDNIAGSNPKGSNGLDDDDKDILRKKWLDLGE
jgi:replicative DNA helicase